MQIDNLSRTIFILILCATGVSCDKADQVEESASSSTRVVLLGTGTPNPDPERSGSAVAIVVNDVAYLIDFGPGVIRRAAAASAMGIAALSPKNIKYVFLTHLHSDHTAGYADLIFSAWVLGRKDPLEVYGPKGIDSMTEHVLAAYEEDIAIRLNGLEPANPDGYRVNSHEIEPGLIYEDSNVKVEAIRVQHGTWKEAYGFRFITPDKTIVISGDTAPSDAIIEAAKGADILIHEVYSEAGFARREPVWQRYHAAFHTSSTELAEIASKARPGLTILYHQLFWGTTDEDLVKEIEKHYDGKLVSGADLQVF